MIDTAHLQPHHVPAFGGTICQWDLRAVCLRILRYRLRLRSAFALSICAFQRLGIAFGLCACAKPSETKKRHFYAQPCTIYLSFMTYELSKSYPQLKQDSISWRTYIFQFPENRHFDERSLELSNAGKKDKSSVTLTKDNVYTAILSHWINWLFQSFARSWMKSNLNHLDFWPMSFVIFEKFTFHFTFFLSQLLVGP